jgi:hypothetical protein
MSSDPAQVEEWLRRLKWSLASLSPSERDDIVAETRGHLREVLAAGRTPSAALAGFGRPEEYAQRFIDDIQIVGALGSQEMGPLLRVVGRQVNRRLVAVGAALGTVALSLLALIAVTMLVLKLSDPVHAGLWCGANQFFIGKIDNPADATELLGFWLYPVCVGILTFCWIIGRLTLLSAVRTLARTRGAILSKK